MLLAYICNKFNIDFFFVINFLKIMVKKLTINCNFKTGSAPMEFYIGDPSDDNHPLHFQSKWLAEKRGGTVPKEIFESFAELQKIAAKNRVSFEELCSFAFEELQDNIATIEERKRINKNLSAITQKSEQEKKLIENKNDNKK